MTRIDFFEVRGPRWDLFLCGLVERALDAGQRVYLWADAIYSGLSAEQTKPCALVVIGVNERGQKRFLATEDGVREATQRWRGAAVRR